MSKKLSPRIMIAKPGLDGHDRGAVIVVQGLRDAGFDVIYTGLRRTPQEIASAAAQEDVDVLGLSVLSGAHMTVLKAILEELVKLAWRPSLLLAGGIIPSKDEESLKQMGFDLVFGPGTSLDQIATQIRDKVPERSIRKAESELSWVNLAKELTKLEIKDTPSDNSANKNKGRIVVIAGQGGVGKSTLIGELIHAAIAKNVSIAVIANDPSGAQNRGAILADRLRMPMHYPAEKCLIRSIPVYDSSVGVSAQVGDMAKCVAKNYDLVIVESLGVSQHQYLKADWVDLSVAAVSPGSGDQWQLRKSALLDVCDAVFITKSDLPDFEPFFSEMVEVLHDKRKDKMPVVLGISCKGKTSIGQALDMLYKR